MTLCYNVSLTCSLPYLALYEAFSILGYGTIYNTSEVLRRHQERSAVAALDAKYDRQGRKFGIKQFESLWSEYSVISGEAVVPNAEELIDLYPDATVILTVRDDEEMWLASMRDTMWRQNME